MNPLAQPQISLKLSALLFVSVLTACSLSDVPQVTSQATPRLICLDEKYAVTCQITSVTPSATSWMVYGGSLLTSGSAYAHIACPGFGGFVSVSARVTYEGHTTTLYGGATCGSGPY